MLMMFFGMFMFILFGFFTDTEGKFWFQGADTEEQLNDIYGKCKDESSSLSLVFFNINTDPLELRQCLRQEAWFGTGHSEETINRFDIPAEFKEILIDVKHHEIAEAKKELELRIAANPPTLSEDEVIVFVNDWILSNQPKHGGMATQFTWDPYESWRHGYERPTWNRLCVLDPIEWAKYNGEYWEFGGEWDREGKPGFFLEEEKYIYIDISHRCGPKELAIQGSTETFRLDPKDPAKAYLERGSRYYNLGHYKLASGDFNALFWIYPEDPAKANLEIGGAYYSLGQYELAIQEYDEASLLCNLICPESAHIYYNRGMAYEKLGDASRAEQDFAKAKELGIEAP